MATRLTRRCGSIPAAWRRCSPGACAQFPPTRRAGGRSGRWCARDFRITKADDLDLRPIHHYLAGRVRGHVLICMLACYLTWHLRQALAELTFTDPHIPAATDPVAPAQRSPQAKAKDGAKHNRDGLTVYRYRDLLAHLATLDRQTITFNGRPIEKLTTPTPIQRRAFELLGTTVPLTIT